MKRRLATLALLPLLAAGCADRVGPPREPSWTATPRPYVPPTFGAARAAGATLVLLVPDCDRPLSSHVEERPDEVRVTLLVGGSHPLPCETGGRTTRVTVRLPAPLRGRRLFDGGIERPVPVMESARLLAPRVLPAPFDPRRREEVGRQGYWRLSWPDGGFALSSEAGPLPAPPPCPGRRAVTVRGVRGFACAGPATVAVNWTEGGLPRRLAVGWSEASGTGPLPVDLAGLLRLAETLEPPA